MHNSHQVGPATSLPPEENSSLPTDLLAGFEALLEGVLLFSDSGLVRYCNESFMRAFGMRESPAGSIFLDTFGPNSTIPGFCYSERFFCYGKNEKPPFTAIIHLSSLSVAGQPSHDEYYMTMLPYQLPDGFHTLCLLKKTCEFRQTHSGLTPEMGQNLKDQNRDLLRVNAQLSIENAEKSAVAQALRRAEARYREIVDNANEGIFQWTPDWRLVSANMSFAKIMGYNSVNSLLATGQEEGFHFCYSSSVEAELVAALERRGNLKNFEFQIIRRDGSTLWASMNARRVLGPGGYTNYYEAFIENISSRKLAEEKLVYQAFHDPLTGLANRSLFHDRLKMALRRAGRQSNYSFAVLYLDLDRFKMVNDSLGHDTGDDVLCHVAVEILACVRDVDTVARFGGDEFAVLIDETERSSYAVKVAERIHAVLSRPFEIKNQEINIGASIGIVLRGERYELPEDILRDADTAMYRAKADRSTFFKVFSQKMREETIESIVFETDLRQGIKSKEFYVTYQPIVYMDSGELYGFEALLRWNRKGDAVSPGFFIPVAEETGLIKNLGLYMMEEVCRQVNAWSKNSKHPVVTHLNISGRQLIFPSFPKDVEGILERTGVDPSLLLFEITESVLLDNGGACIQGIQQIRELGVNFCLDDFGTGFSSLSYLRQLPLNSIKVDRSFVADIENDDQSLVILRNLLTLGQDLGLSVVVEGIEREAQRDALVRAGCFLAQGFYFHRPMPVDDATILLCRKH
ncbi:EAL domain-containing protein [Desulfovibrio sp. OttesenSCG-928-G15]|nr:EAL domain-containing protein [Desulfovibrio sp. OttesenSCG-928-G15]